MDRTRVAIIFGGCSEEHEVSVKSAREVAAHIDTSVYEPFYIGISHSGVWKLCKKPSADWESKQYPPVHLSPNRSTQGLLVEDKTGYVTLPLDVLFSVVHGKTGEDGTLQGLFELSGIPYAGCGVQSSAVCMDKSLAYLVAREIGLAIPDFITVTGKNMPDPSCFKYPVFVKPARSGSSFGVSKVCSQDKLFDALKAAQLYDEKVLIEESVQGVEVGCAVMGKGANLITGEVDQVNLSSGIFRIHQEVCPEEGSENATFVVPAPIEEEKRIEVQDSAQRLYRALGCSGLARIDFFLRNDGSIVFNEANTMPGLTSYSRFPRMMAAAGINLSQVVDRCIADALSA